MGGMSGGLNCLNDQRGADILIDVLMQTLIIVSASLNNLLQSIWIWIEHCK